MSELDYSNFFTIKIIRVKDSETGPSHWESQVTDQFGKVCLELTAPTFYGVVDDAVNHLTEDDWHEFDANYKPCSDCDDTGWVEKQIDVDAFKRVPCSCGLGDKE